MWNCERVYPWYIPMNHTFSWLTQFFLGETALFFHFPHSRRDSPIEAPFFHGKIHGNPTCFLKSPYFDGKSRGPTRGKGERFEGPQHGAEALRLAADIWKKNMKKKHGDWIGGHGREYDEYGRDYTEITRDHFWEYMSPFSILMIFFETYWGWRHWRFDECPVDEVHGVYTTQQTGVHFLEGVHNP